MLGVRKRDWESLAFRCLNCGIGYSNATNPDARVRIVRTVELAVPAEVHDRLGTALDQAFNVRNRPSKRNAFCSASSEDAVTWTIFRGLAGLRQLGAVAQLLAPGHSPSSDVDLLLWGVPVSGANGDAIRAQLAAVCDELGESPMSRSEPDVIIATETLLIFIEAKTGSANDVNPTSKGWPKYLKTEALLRADRVEVQSAGYYELVRNWVIGNKLADKLGRDFLLVNLGPQTLTRDVKRLRPLLVTTAHREIDHRRWQEMLASAAPLTPWLDDYADRVGIAGM